MDFGRLDEDTQEWVLHRLAREPMNRRELKPPNLSAKMPNQGSIEANRGIVEQEYNGERYGKRLAQIYSEIIASGTDRAGAIQAEALLDCFLAPERFFLLRS